MRFGAALGTTLKRGARVVASRESAPGIPHDQARDHLRAQLDRRAGRRPAHAARAGRQAPAEDAGLRRGVPRRRVDHRPGGRADPALRAARRRALRRRCRRRSRSTSRARSCAACRSARSARSRTRRAARESYANDLLADLDVERDPLERLPDRRRLRLLGGVSFVLPLVLGPLGRRGDHRARVRVGREHDAGAARRDDRPGAPPGARRRGDARRGLRPLGRAALPDRRDAAARSGPTRRCCSSCA